MSQPLPGLAVEKTLRFRGQPRAQTEKGGEVGAVIRDEGRKAKSKASRPGHFPMMARRAVQGCPI